MKKLEFCQNTFDIDPHGILIWSKLNTAIVSDLHLEKGSSFAKYGQYIPPYDSLETLIKLEKILSNYVIKKIILLGDIFHDKDGFKRLRKVTVNTLEKICIETVESGSMTKDLAILISKGQKYLTTNQFLEVIDSNLKKKLN